MKRAYSPAEVHDWSFVKVMRSRFREKTKDKGRDRKGISEGAQFPHPPNWREQIVKKNERGILPHIYLHLSSPPLS
jgi:hypothetical protein